MPGWLIVVGVIGLAIVVVAILMSTGPRWVVECTCGLPDCEGECLGRSTGRR